MYLAAIVLFFCLLILFEIINNKKRKAELVQQLIDKWGTKPDFVYRDTIYDNITFYYSEEGQKESYIDDITWKDLDMDNFYKLINNTQSSIGMEYLYYLLRKPCFSNDELKKRSRLINVFSKEQDVRINIQTILRSVGNKCNISVYKYMQSVMEIKAKKCVIHYIQGFLLALFFILIFFNVKIAIGLTVGMIFINIITYFSNKANMNVYLDFFAIVIAMSKAVDKISLVKNDEIKIYSKEMDDINKVLKKVKKGSFLLKSDAVSGNFADVVMDYIKMLFHVDIIMFYSMLDLLQKNSDKIFRLYEILGYMDSMCAVASFRKYLDYYCEPELVSSMNVEYSVKDVFHPFITKPVCNSIDTNGCVLITGSNASGKSTFIKTLAINAILSQTIYTSISKEYKGTFFNIYSSMALADNLLSSESYYIVEIKSLKRILDADRTKAPVLCFVDEVLRGTNTIERIAASSQILLSLANTSTMCFAATHDIELTQILKNTYESYHFQENVVEDDVMFDYTLYKGPATSRNAIKLLKVIGYNDDIIDKANNMAGNFINNNVWSIV